MCAVTLTADSTMLKTVFTECDGYYYRNSCARVLEHTIVPNVSHLRTKRKKTVPVFSSEDRVSAKLMSHEIKECFCASIHECDAC